MSTCPEFDKRASMSDPEFWEHVFLRPERPVDFGWEVEVDPQVRDEPCPECGEHGACAWDAEGRPLIHATSAEEER